MKLESRIALKEWDVVVRRLSEGKQIFLVRKGGIGEEGGEFKVKESEFFLFPTFEHQSRDQIQPQFLPLLTESVGSHQQGRVPIEAYAVVSKVMEATDRRRLLNLSDKYLWNADYINARFDFHPEDPLYVLFLRTYKLPQSKILPDVPEYAGCRSWISLVEPISTEGALPALQEDAYIHEVQEIITRLNSDGASEP